MRTLLALLLAASLQAQALIPQGNLGGGCVPPGSYVEVNGFGNDQLRFYEDNGGIWVDGILGIGMLDPVVQLTFFGVFDPQGALPSCGCTMHATPDVWMVGTDPSGDVHIDYPASMVGVTIYAQAAYVPLVQLPYGCDEVGIRPMLSDGFWLTLP